MSERGLVVPLAALALVLGLVVAVEATRGTGPEPAVAPVPLAAASEAEPAAEAAPAVLVATTLGRPLFAPSRQPASVPAGAAPVSSDMPRLSGIVHGASTRRAIFQGADGKPLSVAEGDIVQGRTVRRIGATEVELVGPAGVETVTPRHDPALVAQPMAVPGMPPAVEPVSMVPPLAGAAPGPSSMPPPPLAGPGPAP
jgi:hypothetical protein